MQSQETGGSALGGGVRFRALSSIYIIANLTQLLLSNYNKKIIKPNITAVKYGLIIF